MLPPIFPIQKLFRVIRKGLNPSRSRIYSNIPSLLDSTRANRTWMGPQCPARPWREFKAPQLFVDSGHCVNRGVIRLKLLSFLFAYPRRCPTPSRKTTP